jgi:hypothetical protein
MTEFGAQPQRDACLPTAATINIEKQTASPAGEVEVEPNVGRIHFVNQDQTEYRLRFWPDGKTMRDGSMDIVLPPGGTVTVAIKTDDSFRYAVLNPFGLTIGGGEPNSGGGGGGPIKN